VSDGANKYGPLVQRFDDRARRLRRQANLFLGIIIVVLGAGTAAFIFANFIANLNLHPQTAEAQYAAATETLKQRKAQIAAIQSKIDTIRDDSSITKPYKDQLSDTLSQLSAARDRILKTCTDITHISPTSESELVRDVRNGQIAYMQQGAIPATDRIGDFLIRTMDRTIYFSTVESADHCRVQFNTIEDKMRKYFRKILFHEIQMRQQQNLPEARRQKWRP